jgi:hypothetical protein
MTHFKKAALALAVASTFTLIGCSNSSSSGGGETITPNTSAQSVSGAAVKGVLKNAKVTVYELNDSGDRIGEVGAATTNDDGEYEAALTSAYQGGLLEIEVTSIPGQTRMVCDASACGTVQKGQDFELPSGFKLSAIAAKEEGAAKVSAPVTAWSTMAANRAKAKAATGGNIAEASKEANFKVQQVVGFDPSKVVAKDVNNLDGASSDEQQAAVMNAVVAEIVFSGADASASTDDYIAKLDKFTRAIENDDSFGDAEDGFRVVEVAEATEKTLETVQVTDATAVSKLQKQQEVFSDPENSEGVSTPDYDPDLVVGDTATQAEKIESFKTFVASVRSWATSIEALDTAQLGAVVDVETIQTVFSEGPVTSLKLAQEIVNQSLDQVTLTPAEMGELLETGNTKQIFILDNGVEVGTAVLSVTDESGVKINVIGQMTGEANTNFLPFNLTIKTNLPVSAFDLTTENIKSLLANSEVVISGAVENGSGQAIARLNDVTARLQLANALIAGTEGFVTDNQVIQAFVGASLSGNVELFAETGESFSGNVEAQLTKLAKNRFVLNDTPVSIRKLRVAGTFTAAAGETFDASATLNVNNASEFDTLAWLDYSEERRWVDVAIDGTDILSLFGADQSEAAVSSYVDINAFNDNGVRSGHLWTGGYFADGQPKFYQVNYQFDQGKPSVDALAGAIAAKIPSVTVEYDDGGLEPTSITVDVAQALAAGGVTVSYNSSEQLEFPSEISISASAIGSDYPGINANSEMISTPDFDEVYAYLDETGGLSLWIRGGSVDDLVSGVLDETLAITGANWKEFRSSSFENSYSYVEVSFSRPATLELYNQCLSGAQAELALLEQSYLLEWNSEEAACAEAILNVDSFYEDLDEVAIDEADGAVRAAFASKYGESLASQLELGYYYISAISNGQSYISGEVEFPNLESESSFIDASLTVSATARNIPDMPEAKVTVTANRNSFLGGQLFATLKYDQGQYEIEVSSDNLDQPTEINGRFYDAYGKELVLKANFNAEGDFTGLSGDALLNGEDIGDVTLRNGIPVITYPNGDETVFESLF